MRALGISPSRHGLDRHGIHNVNQVYWNLGTAALVENAIRRGEGLLAAGGALVVRTGQYTGRSPDDKFVVREPSAQDQVWWGPVNRPFDPARFDALYGRLLAYLQGGDLYVQDCFAGADPAHRIPIRVITEYAWHSLFARLLFVRADWNETPEHVPHFTIIDVPKFHAYPELDGTRSEAFVVVHFGRGLVIIGGTSYAGEIWSPSSRRRRLLARGEAIREGRNIACLTHRVNCLDQPCGLQPRDSPGDALPGLGKKIGVRHRSLGPARGERSRRDDGPAARAPAPRPLRSFPPISPRGPDPSRSAPARPSPAPPPAGCPRRSDRPGSPSRAPPRSPARKAG